MRLPKAENIVGLAAILYAVGAALAIASVLFSAAFSSERVAVAVLIVAVAAAALGFTSLIVVYVRDREHFPFLLGLALGFSLINRGLAQVPQETFSGSAFLQLVSCVPPVAASLALREAARRLRRDRSTKTSTALNNA